MPGRTNAAWVPDDRYSLLLAGTLWTLLALMIVPEGLDYRLLVTTQAPASGDLVSRTLWLALLATAGAMIVRRASLCWLLLRWLNPFLLLFLALAIASIVWSVEPLLTLRRDIRLVTIAAVCIAFALSGWHMRRFQNVLRPALTIFLIGSIIFGLAAPALAIHQEAAPELAGAWRGLANHKNTFGALACTTLILWLHAWMAGEVRWLKALPGSVLAAACLWLSRSSTSALSAALAILLLLMLMRPTRGLQSNMRYVVVALVALLVTYALALLRLIPGFDLLLAPISMLTGVDMTFTGRSEIWAIIVEHIHLNPLLGVGYGAYWAGPVAGSPSFEFIWRMNAFYPGSAHSGYLEVANDLGAAGLICLLFYIAMHVRQSLRVFAADQRQGALLLALFIQQALMNLSESHWFSVQSVQFVILTLITTALARSMLDLYLRARLGEPHWQMPAAGAAPAAAHPAAVLLPAVGGRA
jgi:O-antigen ligase